MEDKMKDLIYKGCNYAGITTAAVAGFLAGSPIVAGGIALTSAIFSDVISDIAKRDLSDKEEERIGKTACLAIDEIRESLEVGRSIRSDDFFDRSVVGRSSNDEIFEGVLRKAKDEYQEKKIEYLSYFYHNIVMTDTSIDEAHYFLKEFDKLGYNQICILGLLYAIEENPLGYILRDSSIRDSGDMYVDISAEKAILLQDIMKLNINEWVGVLNDDGGQAALLGIADIIPSKLVLTTFGERFVELFSLEKIRHQDLDKIIELLQ